MNVHESEKVAGVLENRGLTKTDNLSEAQVVVINTCAIRENAEKKIESFIGNLKALKKAGSLHIVAVGGCMTQQNGRAVDLHQKFPFLDIIFGTHNLVDFDKMLEKALHQKKSVIEVVEQRDGRDLSMATRTSGVNAWVNIMHGCNNFCTYCIVPYVRGREISRPMADILDEIKGLLADGYKQITLLGQNVNSYGNDIQSPEVCFANLLKQIDALDGKFRLRFMTPHPKDLTDEVIEVIANSKHICHGLHLPVQSGSTKVLEKMNRKYTREQYLNLVKRIKAKITDVELTTDIIVGFAGETEEDFAQTMSLIEEVRYQQIFGFIYSRRKGTVADKFDGQIPLSIKKERLARLIEKEREIASDISASYVGKTVEILIEGTNKGKWVGTTDQNKNVHITAPAGAEFDSYFGKFVKVKIKSSKLTVLYGEIINEND